MHRDGYGFLIADRPIEGIAGDIFIPPESAEKAMHGDRVVVRIARIEAGGRADGEIVKVLKRAHPTVVGEFRIGRRGQYVVPHDERIQQWIEIPEGMEIPAGRRRRSTASASTAAAGFVGRGTGRHDRQRGAARISRSGAQRRWAA